MKTLNVLFLLAVDLSVVAAHSHDESHRESHSSKYSDPDEGEYTSTSVDQFARMIRHEVDATSIFDVAKYTDYGCYCGLGGSGTPVDDLDRCCQVHDECYGKVQVDPNCSSWFGKNMVPYIKRYDYALDEESGKAVCLDSNDECQMVLCECDRAAAECFAKSDYNEKNKNLDLSRCLKK